MKCLSDTVNITSYSSKKRSTNFTNFSACRTLNECLNGQQCRLGFCAYRTFFFFFFLCTKEIFLFVPLNYSRVSKTLLIYKRVKNVLWVLLAGFFVFKGRRQCNKNDRCFHICSCVNKLIPGCLEGLYERVLRLRCTEEKLFFESVVF